MSSNTCVFINCPFDKEYSSSFDALVFVTVFSGLHPRCAMEGSRVEVPRIERIRRALFESKYSIHDLSRCTVPNLSVRLNTALELGMAISLQQACPSSHRWAAYVPESSMQLDFVTDLAGYDLLIHDETPTGVASRAFGWLSQLDGARPATEREMLEVLPEFQKARLQLDIDWPTSGPPWDDVVSIAREVCK